ncbi:hypothetical protein INQ29_24215, partial [Escherichia coli]|nr:hypothetical protein [Escherichia coli]
MFVIVPNDTSLSWVICTFWAEAGMGAAASKADASNPAAMDREWERPCMAEPFLIAQALLRRHQKG